MSIQRQKWLKVGVDAWGIIGGKFLCRENVAGAATHRPVTWGPAILFSFMRSELLYSFTLESSIVRH